jgi:hypothetical protein
MSNVQRMRNHLKKEDFYMEELKEDDGSIFFRAEQNIKGGGLCTIVISFNVEETMVDLYIYNVAHISDPLKKESLHKLLNDLNKNYRFSKFTEHEGKVTIKYSFSAEKDKLNAEDAFDTAVSLYRTAEENYSKFMKLQWA